MTKREFIKQCAIETDLSQKQVLDVIEYILTYIKNELNINGSVQCLDLGKFDIVQKMSKKHYNFLTGGFYPPRQYKAIKFTPSKRFMSSIE